MGYIEIESTKQNRTKNKNTLNTPWIWTKVFLLNSVQELGTKPQMFRSLLLISRYFFMTLSWAFALTKRYLLSELRYLIILLAHVCYNHSVRSIVLNIYIYIFAKYINLYNPIVLLNKSLPNIRVTKSWEPTPEGMTEPRTSNPW